MKHKFAFAFSIMAVFALLVVSIALAAGPAEVSYEIGACGETAFTASATGSSVSNQWLVVDTENTEVQAEVIPTDGSSVEITTGPFYSFSGDSVTVSWHVFGGGERDYDQPHWNFYGDSDFNSKISNYYNEVGTFSWVISGTDDPNPFVTWNNVEVESCTILKDDCKDGGWMYLVDEDGNPFKNQGACVSQTVP